MAFIRLLYLTLFLIALGSFVIFAFTGNMKYKKWGLRLIYGTLLATTIFFIILFAQNLRV